MGEFVPLYRQVAQRIFRKIQQGVYKYGDKIPSEKELAAYYGVNRMTVHRAVSLLSEQSWEILFTQRQLMPSRIEQTVRGVRI